MQRVVILFLIYLLLLTVISWIPAPYRLKERFSTGFNMKSITPSLAETQEAAGEASSAANQAKFDDCISKNNCWGQGGHIQLPNSPTGMCARYCAMTEKIDICSIGRDFIECPTPV